MLESKELHVLFSLIFFLWSVVKRRNFPTKIRNETLFILATILNRRGKKCKQCVRVHIPRFPSVPQNGRIYTNMLKKSQRTEIGYLLYAITNERETGTLFFREQKKFSSPSLPYIFTYNCHLVACIPNQSRTKITTPFQSVHIFAYIQKKTKLSDAR